MPITVPRDILRFLAALAAQERRAQAQAMIRQAMRPGPRRPRFRGKPPDH